MLELKRQLHAAKRSLYPERQRLTLPPKTGEARGAVLEDDKRLAEYGLKDGDAVLFKDLGPQVSPSWDSGVHGVGRWHGSGAHVRSDLKLWPRAVSVCTSYTPAHFPGHHYRNPLNSVTILVPDVSQIGYSTVFFWEYFGPLVVYPLFFFLPHFLYPGQK